MKIDLHIHSKDGSDGRLSVREIISEARRRAVGLLSITDHDSLAAQATAAALARENGIQYLSGVELNIAFSHPAYRKGKAVSLDLLGYGFDFEEPELTSALEELRVYRRRRASQILLRLNEALAEEGGPLLAEKDLIAIESEAEGSLGRPHIADYLVKRGIAANRQQAFDRYLVRCNVPKKPLSIQRAAQLIHRAGGKLVLAHPNDPNGTSLALLTTSLPEQMKIIEENMLAFLDGIECWHPRHDPGSVSTFLAFARHHGLLATGGSDCHQHPVIIGSLDIPLWVADQFTGKHFAPAGGKK